MDASAVTVVNTLSGTNMTNTQTNAANTRTIRRQDTSEGSSQVGSSSSPAQRNDKRRDMHIISVTKGYKGSTPELGEVLGLRTENVDKKVAFDLFVKNLTHTP